MTGIKIDYKLTWITVLKLSIIIEIEELFQRHRFVEEPVIKII